MIFIVKEEGKYMKKSLKERQKLQLVKLLMFTSHKQKGTMMTIIKSMCNLASKLLKKSLQLNDKRQKTGQSDEATTSKW